MEYVLENNMARLVVDTNACQITSFRRKDCDFEYMWQGDPKYWAGRNPTLFPHVSASKNKVLTFKGQQFNVGNHGFTRRSEFEFVKQDKNKLLFRLKDNENTLKEYPYHFELDMEYILIENEVTIRYTIKNLDEEVMPFGFGLHPAFNCPLEDNKQFEDYHIEFNDGSSYQLSYKDLQEQGTIVFDKIKFNAALLTDGNHGVQMKFDGYKIFTVWSPLAPFVCLEPWVSHLDNSKDYPMPFEDIEGITKLNPQQEYHISYSIRIL